MDELWKEAQRLQLEKRGWNWLELQKELEEWFHLWWDWQVH